MGYSRAIATAILATSIIGIGTVIALSTTSISNNNTSTITNTYEPFTGVKEKVEYESIPYETKTVNDNTLEYGQTAVKSAGSYGKKSVTYKVTYEADVQVTKEKVSETVIEKPVDRVIRKGTKIIWHCVDATSYDKNPYNDNYCKSSTGEWRYVSDSQARGLDPTYTPGTAGHPYYNSF